MNYPTQVNPNGWSVLGNALQQGGKVVDDYQTQQDADAEKAQRLKMLMEDMAMKKQEAAMAKIKADRDAKMEADKEARAAAAAEFAKGEIVSPTLAANPSLTRSAAPLVPGGPTQAELDDLGTGILPSQQVSGQSATAMMGAALDRAPQPAAPGRLPRTRDEIIQNQLENRQITGDQYGTLTKPVEKKTDYFNNPDLLADYRVKSQEPGFQKLAEGYAKDPQKYGPAVQNWANRNGYAGQKWWNTELDNMVHQSPFAMANKDETSPDDVNYWAGEYAAGRIDPQTLSNMFSSRGGKKADVMRQIVQAAQGLNSDVNVAKDISDNASSKNQKNKVMLATIDNVKARMGRLQELSSSIDRTRFPTLNSWIQSGEKAAGDMNANLLALNEKLTGEELTPVFGGGTAGSNAKMDLALQVSELGKLPVDVAIAKVKELNAALDTRKKTYLNQMGRYGGQAPKAGGKKNADDYLKAAGL